MVSYPSIRSNCSRTFWCLNVNDSSNWYLNHNLSCCGRLIILIITRSNLNSSWVLSLNVKMRSLREKISLLARQWHGYKFPTQYDPYIGIIMFMTLIIIRSSLTLCMAVFIHTILVLFYSFIHTTALSFIIIPIHTEYAIMSQLTIPSCNINF